MRERKKREQEAWDTVANRAFESYQKRKLPAEGFSIEKIAPQEAKVFGEIFCEAYKLSGNFTVDDIANFVAEKTAENAPNRLFAILDDFDQACYTFGHACNSHLKEDTIEALWDAEGIHKVWSFEKRAANFKSLLREVPETQIYGKRFWQDKTAEFPSIKATDWTQRETLSYVQIVPVESSAEALISFPNGYFNDDYSPFETYRLIDMLEKEFSLSAFGIGANYIGFSSEEPIIGDRLINLAGKLSQLYRQADKEVITKDIKQDLDKKTIFYLLYADR